jgi:DNA-binding transcriptional regulator YbjK
METKNASKLPRAQRHAVILSAAVIVANRDGLSEVTFKTTADACNMPTKSRTVSDYFKIGELRQAVIADSRTSAEVQTQAVAMGIK